MVSDVKLKMGAARFYIIAFRSLGIWGSGKPASPFNRILLSEPTGAIFENDNHSVRATAPAVPGTLVVVPEPASLAWCGLGLLALRRRR